MGEKDKDEEKSLYVYPLRLPPAGMGTNGLLRLAVHLKPSPAAVSRFLTPPEECKHSLVRRTLRLPPEGWEWIEGMRKEIAPDAGLSKVVRALIRWAEAAGEKTVEERE